MLNTGSYQIYIKVKKRIEIKIGALGTQVFEKGTYVYSGSAMNNLEKRVLRHIKTANGKNRNNPKWHIDYLLSDSNIEILKIDKFHSALKEECIRNRQVLNLKNSSVPVKGFGSSDCKQCSAHLIRIE